MPTIGDLQVKSLRKVLVVGEKNILGEIAQIVNIASEANTLLQQMLSDNQNEKVLDNGMQSIRILEDKSDKIAFKVTEDITTGAISPNVLEHLLECVHVADDIVDTYYYQSREINRMHKARFPYSEALQENEWIGIFKSMIDLAEKALLKVKQTLSAPDLTEMRQLRREIEALESQGDDIKDKGFDLLYRLAPQMHYLQFTHYSELLHKFDDILDGCEDLSDLILSVITSILK